MHQNNININQELNNLYVANDFNSIRNIFQQNLNLLNSNEIVNQEIKIIEENYTLNYDSNLNENKEESCWICLEMFKNEEKITKIKCGHTFHLNCSIDWFKNKFNCPVCRRIIRKDIIDDLA